MADQVTAEQLVLRARGLVNTAAAATAAEWDEVTALENRLEFEGSLTVQEAIHAIRGLLNRLGDPGSCRACGLAIWWVVTKNEKRAPYHAAGLNHFGDCPKAGHYRGRR